MNGSIQKRGKNSWRLCIEQVRDEHGKRKRTFVTVKGTKSEAQRQLRELVLAVDKGLSIDTSKATVGQFLEQWLKDYAETNTASRTVEGYRGNIRRYLVPHMGSIPLAKLTPQHVQGLYSSMLEKGLSARTVLHTHRVLSEALKHAVKWGLLMRNVCDAVDPPRTKRKEMKALDSPDVQRLLNATAQTPYGPIFFLALYTGLRRGELLGLRWSDIDLKNNTLSVNQNVIRLIGKGITVAEPKTAHSRRVVNLPPSAAMLLGGLKAKLREQREIGGMAWAESAFVFCNHDGGPISPDTVSHAFRKVVKQIGLPAVRFHDLRHTHATLMLKQGVHPKIVSERLGHASITITLDTYSHVLPTLQETAALAFEEALESTSLEAVSSMV